MRILSVTSRAGLASLPEQGGQPENHTPLTRLEMRLRLCRAKQSLVGTRECKLRLRTQLVVTLIVTLLLNSACSSESDRVYAEAKRCATALSSGGGCSKPPVNVNTPLPSPTQSAGTLNEPNPNGSSEAATEESRVYLDATESMQGFTAAKDTTFTKLVEALSYAMPGSRLYKYGMSSGSNAAASRENFAREIHFSQELRKSSFYDLDYNEDDALFNYLAAEDQPTRSVLVTDGVYSARQSEFGSEVVKAINKWLEKGRFFGILIFTSPFQGKLYSENRRTWLDGINVGARPFFVFVFSPTEKGFRDLRQKLAADFKDMQALVFPREAVSCPLIPIVEQGLEHKDIPPASPYYLHMYNESLFGTKSEAELTYDFRCTPVNDYPVAELDVEVTLDSYSWLQQSFQKPEHDPEFRFVYDDGEKGSGPSSGADTPALVSVPTPAVTASPTAAAAPYPRLKLVLQRDLSTPYTLCRINFGMSIKSLRSNIRSLTTEDDSQPGDAEKTYRFFEFISALSTAHLKNKPTIRLPPPVFVTLKNK